MAIVNTVNKGAAPAPTTGDYLYGWDGDIYVNYDFLCTEFVYTNLSKKERLSALTI